MAFGILTADDPPVGSYAYQNTEVLDRLVTLKRAPPLSHLSRRNLLRCAISVAIGYGVLRKHGF